MMNMKNYKDFIQDSVISRLERLMGNKEAEAVNLWEKYGSQSDSFRKEPAYKSMLHERMLPYYEMYLNGDTRLCCAGCKLETIGREMAHAIADDDQFGSWASEQNLIVAAEGWGDNMKHFEGEQKRIYRFFRVLEELLKNDGIYARTYRLQRAGGEG